MNNPRRKPENKINTMKTNKTMIAGAALAGILTGGFAAKAAAQNSPDKGGSAFAAGIQAADEKADSHDCKGKNSCKGKGGCNSKHVPEKK